MGGIIFINVLWSAIKYRAFSLPAAMAGVFFVRLRWSAVIISGLYFACTQNYYLAFLAVLWPVLCALIVVPGKLNSVRILIAKSIGYNSELQMKSLLAEDEPTSAEKKISLRLPGKLKKTVMPFEDSSVPNNRKPNM